MKIERHHGFRPGKTTVGDVIRYVLMGMVGILFLWTLLPLFAGIFHTGMAGGLVLFGGILLLLFFWKRIKRWIKRTVAGKIAMTAVGLLLAGVLASIGILSIQMVSAAYDAPKEEENGTVVVLGAKVGSLSLQKRMEAAYQVLLENPDAVCVASGGKGDNEHQSEAEAIRDYLVQKGIDQQRIFVEDRSTNTEENLKFTKQIIEQNGLSKHLIVVTDDYHQLRAKLNAQKQGLTVSAYSSHPQPFMLLSYWEREWMALAYTICFGG